MLLNGVVIESLSLVQQKQQYNAAALPAFFVFVFVLHVLKIHSACMYIRVFMSKSGEIMANILSYLI